MDIQLFIAAIYLIIGGICTSIMINRRMLRKDDMPVMGMLITLVWPLPAILFTAFMLMDLWSRLCIRFSKVYPTYKEKTSNEK